MKLTMNRLYICLSFFIFLNLACDDNGPTQADSTDTNLIYCLDMVNTIEGGAFDYADNNTTDQRVLTISLNSTLTDCESGSLSPVSNASILFDWIITDAEGNEYDLSGSTEPHMQTIPIGSEDATDIYENQSSITDENGEVKLYWIDEGQSGCIFLDCEYTDDDDNIWSLSSPGSSCLSSIGGNPFEVKAVEASYSSVSFFTLNSSLDVLVYNDLPASVDSTQSLTELTLDAIVKDENGVALQYIPVQFINTTPSFGTLTESSVISNSYGIAQNNLVNIVPEEIGSNLTSTITIEAKIVDETGATIQTDTKDITIIPQSLNNIFQVSNLDAVFLQSISLINNINLSYADTIVAQVLNENNTPIKGVPISFNLASSDIGYLDTQLVYTDEQGFAKSVFHISQADLADISDSNVPVSIQVFVSDDFNQTLNRTYVINGNANIEDDVNQFNFFPQTLSSMNTYAQPSNTTQGEYQGITEFLPFIAKSSSGQGIPGVPVQFEIYESTRNSFGSLSTALAYTCCSDNASQSDSGSSDEENTDDTGNSENSDADTLYDWNGDGDTTVDENMGIATVIYNNSVTGATDYIRAFILNPSDQSSYIDVSNGTNNGKEEFSITTMYSDELASTVLLNTIPSSLNFGDSSSASTDDGGTTGGTGDETTTTPDNCATIYAIAFNNQGGVLEGIPINFSMNDVANDSQYGILTEFYAVTDSIEVAPFVAAQTKFCTFENVTINMINDVNIQIDATLSNNSSVTIPSTQITITQNSSSLGLITLITDSELPNSNNNETTPVTVTVTNQSGNIIQNTLVEFQSLTEDDNGDLTENIGSFDPTYSFTNESGIASSTFNMGNDVGLATIITTVPEYSLADTSYISITSSEAEYIQISQPYPNEITVAGGGGLESTELTVEVKDGNGNLVSKPYLIYFELGINSPNATFINVEDQTYGCIESSNGMGSVTLNSGNQPGSVPVSVSLFEIGDTSCMGLGQDENGQDIQPPISASACLSIFINSGGFYDNCELASLDAIPVTVVGGSPHSGEVNFSYVDISPIGGGLYQVPLSVELEDEWANPVQDSTNVYIWVEGFARSFDNTIDYPNEGSITDTVKWGIEIENEIDIRDSLRYVLQRPDLFNNGQNPNQMNAGAINGTCNCYRNELFNSCSSDGGTTTDCVWEIMPSEPGSVIGEAKTGMLSPDDAYIPGVAWSYVYFGTGDMFERVVIKALTYDSGGNILLIDSRNNHQNRPLTLPFWPGTVNVSSSVDAWDFGVQGVGTECYEPDWVNDGALGDELSNGVVITTSLTDYYQYPVSGGTVLLDAGFSTPNEISYNYCDVYEAENNGGDYDDCFVPISQSATQCLNTAPENTDDSDIAANAHDWIACDPLDTDGDGLTGDCSIVDFNNQCSLCFGNGGTWTPDNDDGIPGSFDDDQTQCITNGNGQCFWIIHYNENVIPREEGNLGVFTYQDRISTIITTLQSPLQTSSNSIDISLEKNP